MKWCSECAAILACRLHVSLDLLDLIGRKTDYLVHFLTKKMQANNVLTSAGETMGIRNVVFMGMGEPLDNYDAVLTAIRGMTDVQRFSLGYSQISLSTVGVAPRMRQLADQAPKINLALSLHAPNQELRCEIVPTSKAWHLDKIMEALDYFNMKQQETSNRPKTTLIEYVLIKDVNDSEEVAHQLGVLLKERAVVLNVIPYNPTEVPYDYKPPSEETTDTFNQIVREYGVRTIQRQELGQDIDGACGQLVVKTMESLGMKKGNPHLGQDGCSTSGDGKGTVADLEDLMGGGKAKVDKGGATVTKRSKAAAAAVAKVATVRSSATTTEKEVAPQDNRVKLIYALVAVGIAFLLARIAPRLLAIGE
jgi:sorting nexin-8